MSDAESETPEVLEIRRYSNRRFYDPSRSKHVTLEEIRELVRNGQDVRVIEANTGEDITSRTLTQIILEYDDRKIAALPSDMLHRLIRSSESLWAEFMAQYFKNASRVFETSQRAASEPWRLMAGMPGIPREFAPWWTGPGDSGREPPGADVGNASGEPDASPEAEEDLKRVIDELRDQLNRVQADLRTLKGDQSGGTSG